jgi:hypothetical protein
LFAAGIYVAYEHAEALKMVSARID